MRRHLSLLTSLAFSAEVSNTGSKNYPEAVTRRSDNDYAKSVAQHTKATLTANNAVDAELRQATRIPQLTAIV